MGRMFKPSWGPGLTLLTLSTKKQAAEVHLCSPFERIWSYMYGRLPEDKTSAAVVQRIQILGGNWTNEECLQIFEVIFISNTVLRHFRNEENFMDINIRSFVFIFHEWYSRKV